MLSTIDHINIVVTDLDAMTAFYRDVLAMRVTKQVTISGEWIAAVVRLDDVLADVVYLELPEGPRIELIRYRNPVGASPDGLNLPNTRGLRHMAFRVDDIEKAVQHLRDNGVQTVGEVQTVDSGQVQYAGGARKRLVYFHDPEGTLLELCCYS